METPAATAIADVNMVADRAIAELEDMDALVRAEQVRVYRVLLAMLRDPDAADSLTQECFLKAYQHRGRFRGECSLRTWLMRIAVNLGRDHLKNRRWQFWRRLFHDAPASDEAIMSVASPVTPERLLLAREALANVWTAVDKLPDRQRAVFVLRFVEEMSIEEIAEATSLRQGTVKAHLSRATGAIRERVMTRHDTQKQTFAGSPAKEREKP
jgi:RNA polymerase sigma-70 factor (ECF subfamily)